MVGRQDSTEMSRRLSLQSAVFQECIVSGVYYKYAGETCSLEQGVYAAIPLAMRGLCDPRCLVAH